MNRSKVIIRTGIIGILVNIVLVSIKTAIGLVTNSIAIILDAVNNLSDALSSLITIIGTKLSGKKPDKKHPYGYGRIEYITSAIIAVIVLMAGITSLKESAISIFSPKETSYNATSLIIIVIAIVFKFFCGIYTKGVGKKVNSSALMASGADALFDCILSLGTLVVAIISLIFHINLEGILGLIISLFIVKAGFEILLETLNSIIGERADGELTKNIKEKICTHENVLGAYDLTLHNYGPEQIIGSVHIEVPDKMIATEIHKLTRKITFDIYEEFGVILSVGIYADNNSDPETSKMKETVLSVAKEYPEILQIHGFYAEPGEKWAMFDVISDFKFDGEKTVATLKKKLCEIYPDYTFDIILDSDFSD